MLYESSDYLEAYALIDKFVRECHEVEETALGRRAAEKVADGIRLLLPELQNRVDPKLVVNLIRSTALLGRFLVDTSTPERLFRNMQAYTPRKAKEIKDADRTRQLDDAVPAECADQGRAIAISIKLANLIRPGVQKKLDCKPADTWPSRSAIKGALGRLKAAKSRTNDRAMAKPGLPEASSLLHRMLNEWCDYSQVYALVNTLVKKCHEVEERPSGRRAAEKVADGIDSCYPNCKTELIPSS
jgi:hypothetical protein